MLFAGGKATAIEKQAQSVPVLETETAKSYQNNDQNNLTEQSRAESAELHQLLKEEISGKQAVLPSYLGITHGTDYDSPLQRYTKGPSFAAIVR